MIARVKMHVRTDAREEYETRYKKSFGINQKRGVPEEVVAVQYGDRMEDLIRRGKLLRTMSREAKATQQYWNNHNQLLDSLGWYWQVSTSQLALENVGRRCGAEP